MLCLLVPGTLCHCKDKNIVLESLNLLFTDEVAPFFSFLFLHDDIESLTEWTCTHMLTTVRCNETLFASTACQVRSQDAYYVLQGLDVEMRETAWLWLKVKSFFSGYWKEGTLKFVLVPTFKLTAEPVPDMGFLFEFWWKQNIFPFHVFFCTRSLKFLLAKQAVGNCGPWKHHGGIFIRICLLVHLLCHN